MSSCSGVADEGRGRAPLLGWTTEQAAAHAKVGGEEEEEEEVGGVGMVCGSGGVVQRQFLKV